MKVMNRVLGAMAGVALALSMGGPAIAGPQPPGPHPKHTVSANCKAWKGYCVTKKHCWTQKTTSRLGTGKPVVYRMCDSWKG